MEERLKQALIRRALWQKFGSQLTKRQRWTLSTLDYIDLHEDLVYYLEDRYDSFSETLLSSVFRGAWQLNLDNGFYDTVDEFLKDVRNCWVEKQTPHSKVPGLMVRHKKHYYFVDLRFDRDYIGFLQYVKKHLPDYSEE